MPPEPTHSKVSFMVDRRGKRTHALLPIKEYERLIEDQYDNAVADSRENEGTISLEEAKSRIRARRLSR
jgi:hypothetical protein